MRWLAEAMCPDVDQVLPKECVPPFASSNLAVLATSTYPPMDMTDEERGAHILRFAELCKTLKDKRTVLVGHNLFLDLIYFYTFFFGPLPDRVEGFQKTIAQLFPLVFDTKYLADKINDNSPLYKSSLQEIDQELSKLPVPIIGMNFKRVLEGPLKLDILTVGYRNATRAQQISLGLPVPRSRL